MNPTKAVQARCSAGPESQRQAWPPLPRVPAGAALALPLVALAALRVLVVDDDPVNLVLMTARMAPWGLAPWLAANGAEAVVCACEVPFDLILMDLQMPVLDGLGATLAIRRFEASHGRTAVPVVAHSSAFVAASLLAEHGLNGKLDKPCTDQSLKACLLQWCTALHPNLAADGPDWKPPGPERPTPKPLPDPRLLAGRHNPSPR